MSANGHPRLLVVGGGVSGLTAALEAAETGAEVWLVEREPTLGGRVAALNLYFPKLCPPTCGLEINCQRLRRNPRVHVLTGAEVTAVAGGPGAYRATVRQRPRFVNERCTACGDCVAACPVERPNARNSGLDKTKAVYLPHAMAWPRRYVIDPAVCPGAACAKCVPACKFEAIDLAMRETTQELAVGAIIVATGWRPYDAARLELLGAGKLPNVVTNTVMERLAAPDGPTGGRILRPSDGAPPRRVAFVQCAGSRDENHLSWCSSVCCLASLKQAEYVRRQLPEAEVTIFYIDIRAPGRLELFYVARQADPKLRLVKGKVAKITEDPATRNVTLEAEDALGGRKEHATVELAVLATGIVPESPGMALETLLERDAGGFCFSGADIPVGQRAGKNACPTHGVVPAGCLKRPAEVAACVRDATGAVLQALIAARTAAAES